MLLYFAMNQDLVNRLTEIVQVNLSNENFGPEDLANQAGMSHSSLHRKLKALTGKTISQFIRENRLEKAKKLLLEEEVTIAEIAYKVGFGSATYFNKCFHHQFGHSPGEFRKSKREEPSVKEKIKPSIILYFIASLIILVILFLLLNEKLHLTTTKSPIDKSIAFLPVNYLGVPQYKYKAEGTWEEIKNNLASVKDLTVLDRASVEQYRSSGMSEKQIGKELNVGALLKITFKREDDEIILYVYLIESKNGTILFSKSYKGTEDKIFAMQNEIAHNIADQLNVQLTNNEKQRINKIPTASLTANDFYQKGKNEHVKFQLNNDNKEALIQAQKCYNKALKYDSTFALAYTGLAHVYWDKNFWKEFFKQSFLDSVLILSEKALSFDDQLAEAYNLKGEYYKQTGDFSQAIKEFNIAIELNPNLWIAYNNLARIYLFNAEKMHLAIYNFHQAARLHRGNFLPTILNYIGLAYQWIGLLNQAEKFYQESCKLVGDSSQLFQFKGFSERIKGNYNKSAEWLIKAYQIDPKDTHNLSMIGFIFSQANNFEESLTYFKKLLERTDSLESQNLNSIHRVGYAYLQNGHRDKALYYFNLQLQICNNQINLNRTNLQYKYVYYDLAAVYAVMDDKKKAIENLELFNNRTTMPLWAVNLINDDILLDNIRNEPEFQRILIEVQTKYEKEHKRVKNWLESNNLISD